MTEIDGDFQRLVREGEEFWFDTLCRLKAAGELELVIDLCQRKLPLPAAFRELAVALRKSIRAQRRNGRDPSDQLRALYELAAYERFLFDSPTVEIRSAVGADATTSTYPAFNVAMLAHNNGVYHRLAFPYTHFGTEYLVLLNKTDVKLMQKTWGQNTEQRNPRVEYQAEWTPFVDAFERHCQDSDRRFREEMQRPPP